MSMLNSILAMSGAGAGYVGGKCVDELPHLSLTEACAELPVVICEMQCEFAAQNQAENDAMVEATINAVMTESALDADAIVEASVEGIKKQIKAFFDKILKFIRSIIAKLTLFIDKIVMSGKQLVSKYKKSKMLDKDFTDLSIQGYKFNIKAFKEVKQFNSVSELHDMVKAGVGKDIKTCEQFQDAYKAGWDKDGGSEAKKDLETIKDVSAEDRQGNMMKWLSGVDATKASELKEALYGGTDKETLDFDSAHGDFNFTKDGVISALENPENLREIKKEYERLENSAKQQYNELDKAATNLEKTRKDASTEGQRGLTACADYYKAYLAVVSDSYKVITAIKNAKVDAAKALNAQYKTAFGKMLSYKEAKDNNSFEFDEIDEFDFAI